MPPTGAQPGDANLDQSHGSHASTLSWWLRSRMRACFRVRATATPSPAPLLTTREMAKPLAPPSLGTCHTPAECRTLELTANSHRMWSHELP